MNTNEKKHKAVDAILKNAHREIEPPDSWEALRARIDRRMESGKLSSVLAAQLDRRIAFWRRTAFAMAACLLVTTGLLIYVIGLAQGGKAFRQRQTATANQGLFSQAELSDLSRTFSNVRQLFGRQLPWIMVGSGTDAEIGVDQMVRPADAGKIIIVRLAVNLEKGIATRRYFDVVTFPSQKADFQLPVGDASVMDVSLRPILKNDGIIAVEINAKVGGGSESQSIATVVDDRFTSLVRLRADGEWVNIDGIGQSMSDM